MQEAETGSDVHFAEKIKIGYYAQSHENLDYEKNMPWGNMMYQYAKVGPEDMTFPIPQTQIDLSNGRFIQNR